MPTREAEDVRFFEILSLLTVRASQLLFELISVGKITITGFSKFFFLFIFRCK